MLIFLCLITFVISGDWVWNISIPTCAPYGGFKKRVVSEKYGVLTNMICNPRGNISSWLYSIDQSSGKVKFSYVIGDVKYGIMVTEDSFVFLDDRDTMYPVVKLFDMEKKEVKWSQTYAPFEVKEFSQLELYKNRYVYAQFNPFFDSIWYLVAGDLTNSSGSAIWRYSGSERPTPFFATSDDRIKIFIPQETSTSKTIIFLNALTGQVENKFAFEDMKHISESQADILILSDSQDTNFYFGMMAKYGLFTRKYSYYFYQYSTSSGKQICKAEIEGTDKYCSPFFTQSEEGLFMGCLQDGKTVLYLFSYDSCKVKMKQESLPGGTGETTYANNFSVVEIEGKEYLYLDGWKSGYILDQKTGKILSTLTFKDDMKDGPYFTKDGYIYCMDGWGNKATCAKFKYQGGFTP